MLAILCHLLRGESLIQEKLASQKTEAEAAATATATAAAAATATANAAPGQNAPQDASRRPPRDELEEQGINRDQLQQLMDMGFTRELALDALMQYNSLEQATEYLLNHPSLRAPAVRFFSTISFTELVHVYGNIE